MLEFGKMGILVDHLPHCKFSQQELRLGTQECLGIDSPLDHPTYVKGCMDILCIVVVANNANSYREDDGAGGISHAVTTKSKPMSTSDEHC
jgi:hypothetical protein